MYAMSGRGCAQGDPGFAPVEDFLRRVRTRLVVSSLLGAAALAALVNEVVRWSSATAVVYLGWNVPVLGFLGLLMLAALVPPTLRRWTPAAAAAHADARLGLRDRLASLVDFRGRAEIPEPIRRAQACETARALADTTPAAAAPIAGWRKAGPVLLAACLLYHYLIPTRESRFSPLLNVIIPAWRLAPERQGAPAGESVVAPEGAEPRSEEEAGAGKVAAKPSSAGETSHGRGSAGKQPAAEQVDVTGVDAKTKLPGGDSRKSGDRAQPGRDEGGEDPQQPERIESERVGKRLARVVDPLYRPGGTEVATPLPGGVATFHLLPQAGSAGAGGGPGGEAVAPAPIRVDLDAVLAPYRPIVKAYFDQLARAAVPAGGTPNPEPARSRP